MLQGRSFLKEKDFNKKELMYLIDLAIHLKDLKKKNIPHRYLEGQNIVLLFEKTSTRTRSAFTVAANDLGANPEFMGAADTQFGKKESVEDTAKVFGSMFDGIEFRGFKQEVVEALAEHSGVPVWNGLTDEWHPTQMIADYMTLKEEYGELEGKKLVCCGDGRNNVANSLLMTGAILGVDVTIASPEELFPAPELVEEAQEKAKESGAKLTVTADIDQAVVGADALYTDVWVSMGEEDQFAERIDLLKPYQINQDLADKVGKDFIFLHCLPANHDLETTLGQDVQKEFGLSEMEVSDEIFRSTHARQFEQAENRMHSIKAIMAATNGHLFVPDF